MSSKTLSIGHAPSGKLKGAERQREIGNGRERVLVYPSVLRSLAAAASSAAWACLRMTPRACLTGALAGQMSVSQVRRKTASYSFQARVAGVPKPPGLRAIAS
jgi:hypothetical protein